VPRDNVYMILDNEAYVTKITFYYFIIFLQVSLSTRKNEFIIIRILQTYIMYL